MSKRVADREINHDNWADDEEAEEAGSFQQAPEDEIRKRVIKTARRRANAEPESKSKAIFSGFSFTNSNTKEENQTKTNSSSGIFGNGKSNSSISKGGSKSTFESSAIILNTDNVDKEFYSQLKGLNESVSRWIKNHVDTDPLCILTPIFKDYEKHLKDLQDKYKKKEEKEDIASSSKVMNFSSTSSTVLKEPFKSIPSSSIFGTKPSESSVSGSKLFTARSDSTSKIEESKKNMPMFSSGSATFSFGNSSTSPQSTLPTAGFSFGTSAPFTFGNVSSPVMNKETVSKSNEEEPDEDEPPKVEFKAVIEEDSVYTVRCKVFIKKDDTYVDGGVGNLFLKPVKDKNKTQLIVRADTNLGNLLINVLLSDSIPTQRMGKNNVMMVCIPTPEKGPTPCSILLRVKTSEQADELLEMINKNKC